MTGSEAVTVVLCTRDRPQLLGPAVEAIEAALRPGDALVVVDSASVDPSAAAPAQERGVRVVRADLPGLSRARNVGLAVATTPLVAFTDDDCRPDPDWVQRLGAAFDDPAVGFVTGRVEADRSGRVAVSCMVDDDPHRFLLGSDPFALGVGANMAVRAVAVEGIGGFDDRLGAGAALRAGEDVDLWWRLLQAGWEGRYTPHALVTHVQWRDDAAALRLSYGYGLGAGALAAKAIQARQPGAWGLLAQRLWGDGLRRAAQDVRSGYQSGAVACTLQAVGAATGAARLLLTRDR